MGRIFSPDSFCQQASQMLLWHFFLKKTYRGSVFYSAFWVAVVGRGLIQLNFFGARPNKLCLRLKMFYKGWKCWLPTTVLILWNFSWGPAIGGSPCRSVDLPLFVPLPALLVHWGSSWVSGSHSASGKCLLLSPIAVRLVGLSESDSIVTICGSGDATAEIVSISVASFSDKSVETGISGVFGLSGFCSTDDFSAHNE